MEKTHIEGAGDFYSYYPKLAAVITAHDEGKENAMTVTWHSPVSFKPPLYGIFLSPERYTHELILSSREFCLNFLEYERADLVAQIGGSKGGITDKFSLLNIKRTKAYKVKAPILEDAYISLECRLKERRPYGDHDLFIGQVLVTHFITGCFLPSGIINLKKIKPALYAGADHYVSIDPETLRFISRIAPADAEKNI